MPGKALCLLAFAVSSGAVRVDDELAQAEGAQDLAAVASDLISSGSTELELVARAAPQHGARPASALELTVSRKENAAQKAAERKVERSERNKMQAAASAAILKDKAAHALELAKEAEGEAKYAEDEKAKAEAAAAKHGAKEKAAAKSDDGALAAAEAAARKRAEEEVAAASATKDMVDAKVNKEAGEANVAAAQAKRKAAQSAAFKAAEDAAVISQKAEDVAAAKKKIEREAREKAEREAASASAFHAAHKRDEAEAAELRHRQAEVAAEVAKKATDAAEKHATKLEEKRGQAEESALTAGAAALKKEKEAAAKNAESDVDTKSSAAPCADEGGICYCVGVAVFGEKFDSLEHTLASPVKIKNADGNIGCNSKAFRNMGDKIGKEAKKQCWCVGVMAVEHVEQMAYNAKLRAKDALKKADELDESMRKHQTLVEEEIEREEHEGEAVIEKVQNEIKKVERKVDIAGRRAVDVAKQVDNN